MVLDAVVTVGFSCVEAAALAQDAQPSAGRAGPLERQELRQPLVARTKRSAPQRLPCGQGRPGGCPKTNRPGGLHRTGRDYRPFDGSGSACHGPPLVGTIDATLGGNRFQPHGEAPQPAQMAQHLVGLGVVQRAPAVAEWRSVSERSPSRS